MILLSSHLDRVIQDYKLSYEKGTHIGLLDNFIGILLGYLVLYDDKNVAELAKSGKIKFWHNQGEEWGILDGTMPKVDKKDIIIVVDVADGPGYVDKDFSIENISGFTKKEIKDLKETMEWEGFNVKIKELDFKCEDDEDEAWAWAKLGHKVVSFIIPIDAGPEYQWHNIAQDNKVSYDKMVVCRQGLKRLINYFV